MSRKGGGRSTARLAAVQALYEMDLAGAAADPVLSDFLRDRWRPDPGQPSLVAPDSELLSQLVRGVSERIQDLDGIIGPALTGGYSVKRLETLLRAILRAGTYELLALGKIPAAVVINEYVDVAHAFFEENEAAMVNGVLDRLARTLRAEEVEAGKEEDRKVEPE